MTSPLFSPVAEARLLGGALNSVDWLNQIMAVLDESHFHDPKNASIFAIFKDLYKLDRQVSFDTIIDPAQSKGVSVDHLVNLASLSNTSLFIDDLLKEVEECRLKRALQSLGILMSNDASKSTASSSDLIRSFEEKLFSLYEKRAETTIRPIKDSLLNDPSFLKRIEERQTNFMAGKVVFEGYPTGFADLDTLMQGLSPGHFTIIGARPGVGKTTFALNLIENLCLKANIPTLFFSLEMPNREVVEKLMCQSAEISQRKLSTGNISGQEFQTLNVAVRAWANKCLIIDDQPALGIDQVKSRAMRMKKVYNIKAIFIDYVQLLRSQKAEARHLEIGDISRKLKEIAKELEVPVIGLAQLNREVEKRTDKKPYVSDLRESGALEADADEIILLDRPEMHEPTNKPGQMDVYLAKNRFGPCGQVALAFLKESGGIKNLAKFVNPSHEFSKTSPSIPHSYKDF